MNLFRIPNPLILLSLALMLAACGTADTPDAYVPDPPTGVYADPEPEADLGIDTVAPEASSDADLEAASPNDLESLSLSAAATPSRASLAQQILASRRISLLTRQVSGVNDGADARSNIRDTAAGRAAKRSTYGNAPGGSVQLSVNMLRGILSVAGKYTIRVTAIAGGSHSSNSRHYRGLAFDVDTINGRAVNAGNPYFRGLLQACRSAGATELLGPGDAGHSTHTHCGWPR